MSQATQTQMQDPTTASETAEMEIMILPTERKIVFIEGLSMSLVPLDAVLAEVFERFAIKVKVAEDTLRTLAESTDTPIGRQAAEALRIMANDGISFG